MRIVPAGGRALLGAPAWRWAAHAAAVLPRSVALLARRGTRVRGLLGVPVGLWAWVALLLLVPNTLRNLAYPVVDPTPAEYGTAWGGPTLAGAWAVHAGLALLLVPVWLLVLRGLGALHVRLVAERPRWAVPVVAVLTLALVVLGRAWWHQV